MLGTAAVKGAVRRSCSHAVPFSAPGIYAALALKKRPMLWRRRNALSRLA